MTRRRKIPGGVIHRYQKYDPRQFPSPNQPPPDVVSPAMDHLLAFGSFRNLTPAELARAVHLDPSQINGLGPSMDSVIALLLERKHKILQTYETDTVQEATGQNFLAQVKQLQIPRRLESKFRRAIVEEQLYDLEQLWYELDAERSPLALPTLLLMERLGEKYQVDELAAQYDFSGRTAMTVELALKIKDELERIDQLLKQLEEARETAQIGIIDLDALSEFVDEQEISQLGALEQMVEDYLKELAARQGLEWNQGQLQLTPQAYRLFQGRLLERIFSKLEASRSGRHQGPVVGEGAVEMQSTRQYEFGDSLTHMDIPQSLINAMLRTGGGLPIRMATEDMVVHRTRNTPKCATVVIMDMSGSMRYEGQYINVKRMALALDGLIRSEYPGDFLQLIEMYTFAKPRHVSEVGELLPKPVTIHDPWVQLTADMSREDISEFQVPPHFTNIQHALQMARKFLLPQDTPNRQIILITDGLPTAHFEGSQLYLLYPPHERTEEATMREGLLCQRDNITINMFLIPSWSQSEEDIRFAYRLAETTQGRVFFTGGNDLDRFVVWDYVSRKREILQ